MSQELATQQSRTELTITPDQTTFTPQQAAALQQLGVDRATAADVAVFFHQVKRTGLDPFARQIYMIERQGKQTIQTGIDGFRLIGRRAVDRTGETLEVTEAEWCGPDGKWQDVWLSDEPPAAARMTVIRNGGRFPAIALYSEYVARKRDGSPNMMWATRPAGQLAKCAEALAWRKAFPQDLSGLYTADEMQQADNPTSTVNQPRQQAQSGGSRLRQAAERQAQQGQPSGPARVTKAQWDHITGLAVQLKVDLKEVIASTLDGFLPEKPWELTVEQADLVQKALEDAAPAAEAMDAELVEEEPEAANA